MLSNKLASWVIDLKKYVIGYKNGFYELPYLANTPQSMVNTFINMPFNKHFSDEKIIKSNNPFLQGVLHYTEVEPGLMIIISDVKFKQNVNFKLIYNKYKPIEYYFLSFHINQFNIKSTSALINGFNYRHKSWSLFKPGSSIADMHFKGAHGTFISLYFDNDWFKNQLQKQTLNMNQLEAFISSKKNYLMWPELDDKSLYDFIPVINSVLQKNFNSLQPSEIKGFATDFIHSFNSILNSENVNENHFVLTDIERIAVMKTERYLSNQFLQNFPTIETLASLMGISETKLKSCFKLVYGKGMYQYYLQKRMEWAKMQIENNSITIKKIIETLGYENNSKFTEAFKNQFGQNPSDIIPKVL